MSNSTLPRNRVGLGDAIIMGLSSSGPAQTLAVSLAGLVAVSGYGGVVPILICFVPMMGIAIAYQRLNRWDPSSGATYTWVAKVFHPYLGFLSGWMILLYYTLGTTTLTIPAGVYTLDLLAPSFVDSHWAIFLAGGAWNLLITALAIAGLKVVARFEWVIVVFQYAVLLIVAAVALAALLHGTAAVRFSSTWFSWSGLGGMKGLMGGILIACFMYSGWDASIYVNEETTDRANNPGKAALASVVMLALVYSLVTFAFQSVLPPGEMQAHAGNVLSAVSERLMHKPWDSVMALVVLTGTLATLQAAVVSAARVGLAMSRDRVMPKFFQRLSAGGASPWAATLTMSAINLLLLALALGTSTIAAALTNAASSLGLISIVFYGITAAAALWQQRATLASSAGNLILGGMLPLIGVAFSAWVLVESLSTGAVTTTVMLYGLGSIFAGAIVALFLHRIMGVSFFDVS
ncbi:MAG TPA: APC family permease [Steroidobacteraceae bacterium]|nr:APC family permease [Steroidobacteraceae bacterium]